ncbi:MAG TPA: hypothetical protein VGZ47_04745, partial [Gemmataceae bacterium]|nr:hypothetical protein [Gemmataceae bacterium]
LRTLLAYLDDTLDPAEARDIGLKVAESPVAHELVERIRKVTRRRSLANPPVQGDATKLDPNTVAEYLSDQLSPEQVEEVEQICLEQDVYLAEVAACHQILTLMLTEHAPVPPTARQRMYRLVKGRESIPYRRPPMPQAGRPAETDALAEETPVRWPWYMAGIAVCLVGLAVTIWLALPHLSGTRHNSAGPSVVQNEPERQVGSQLRPAPLPATTPSVNANVGKPERVLPGPLPIREVSSGDSAKAEPGQKAPPKPGAAVAVPKKPIDQAPVDPPSVERREAGHFITPNAVLLHRTAGGKERWQRVAKDARVFTNEQLLSLPGYRSELSLDHGIQLFLWGQVPEFIGPPTLESAATLHAPPAGYQSDITLDRGRLLLANSSAEGPVKVRLRFRDQTWNLTLLENSEVIVDLSAWYTGDIRFSKRPGGEEPASVVLLGVRKGRLTLQIGFQQPIEMYAPYLPPWFGLDSNHWINAFARQPGPALFTWDSKGKAPTKPVQMVDVFPDWRFHMPPISPFREIAGEMQKALDDWSRQLNSRKDLDISLALTEGYNEERPAFQRIGAFGLGAIDIIPPLVDALDDEMKPMLRGSAAKSLQHWCAREPGNDLVLYQILLKKRYTEAQADLYMQLLHGFSETDVTNPDTYQNLLSWLAADRLGIRELALSYLLRLDPDGLAQAKFDPLASADQRDAAIARWRKRIPPGKLPPKPTNQPKPGPASKPANPPKGGNPPY